MTAPEQVTRPQTYWSLEPSPNGCTLQGRVILDGKDQIDADSLCLGYWEGIPVLASRWDRTETNDKGYPKAAYGQPSWYVLPGWMQKATLAVANISPDDHAHAIEFLAQGYEK